MEIMEVKLLLILVLFWICNANSHLQGRYTKNINEFELVYPVKISASGHFLSNDLQHHHTRSHERNKGGHVNDTVHYKITIDKKKKQVVLKPNIHLVANGAVVETRRARTYYKGVPNVHINPLLNEQNCHYNGHIVGEEGSRVSISTCDGLVGYIYVDGQLHMIEPLKEGGKHVSGRHPHILYKADPTNLKFSKRLPNFCGTKGSKKKHPKHKTNKALSHHRTSMTDSLYSNFKDFKDEYFLEVLVVADKSVVKHHKDMDLEQYILTVFNMAHNLYHDASLGVHINLSIVRIIRLEEGETEMNNGVKKIAADTLSNFCAWQEKLNPQDETHPNHHDVATLLTRVDQCSTEDDCGLLGFAYTGGACNREVMCNICEDNGLMLGFVLAHEIGHNLGMEHDSMDESGCPSELPDGSLTVMSPFLSMDIVGWSRCSNDGLSKFLDDGYGRCMEDKPSGRKFKVDDILPGAVYDGNYQCKQLFNPAAFQCKNKFSCKNLFCQLPTTTCLKFDTAPAAGTPCGDDKWCYRKQCVRIGQRPGSVDGQWGSWSEWSTCTRTCGIAVSYSTRVCDNPSPSHGGHFCLGDRRRVKICDQMDCPTNSPSLREEQCSSFDDGLNTWKPYLYHPNSPCHLSCQNQANSISVLSATVMDGTECINGIDNVCIGGVCQALPCDKKLFSKAKADACGVCHGDGTTCKVTQGSKTFINKNQAEMLLDVPLGSVNIMAEETTPTTAEIFIVHKNENIESKPGYFKIGDSGMMAWLGSLKPKQEILRILGPTTQPLQIYVQANEGVTVSYSLGLKSVGKRVPKFFWDFAAWSDCSAACGVGTQTARPQCIEKESGIVEDSHCKHLEKPDGRIRSCRIRTC